MIHFVKKDFIVQKRILILYVLLMGFFMFAKLHPALIIPIVLIQFITNIGYYDDRDKVHLLLNALPGSKKNIVTAKYVSIGLFFVISLIVFTLINYVLSGEFQIFGYDGILTVVVSGLFVAFFVPLSLYFPYSVILIVFFGIYFGTTILINWFVPNFYELISNTLDYILSLPLALVSGGSLFILATLLLISWFSSVKIYEYKKV